MKRRTLIRAVGAAGIAGIAGCTRSGPVGGGGGDGGTDTPTDTPTGNQTDTPTGTDTADSTPTQSPSSGRPEMTGRSFEVTGNECGQGVNRATVEWTDRTVRVTGVISGSNACYTAELRQTRYDADADELLVAVRSYEPENTSYCADCTVDIDYRSEFEFDGGTPRTVSVRHNGERVRRARADGS